MSRDLPRHKLEGRRRENTFAHPLLDDVDELLVLVRSEHHGAMPRRFFGIAGDVPEEGSTRHVDGVRDADQS